jgi:hypothetical protein
VRAPVVYDERTPTSDERADRSTSAATSVFIGVIAVALPLLNYQGRDQWFFLDDWDFLANRTAGSVDDLFAPHVQHWSTVPILVYRFLWSFVGLRHYWVYQLVTIALHLVAAVLLRAIMRRAGVRPWIATAAASLFALLGAGRANIVVAFSMSFTASLALGLAHVLLADHDGPWDRRDVLGILCGLLALMSSGIGIPMAIAVGVATWIRHGWRRAVAHTAPLVAAFAIWFATFGRDALAGPRASPREAADFGWTAVTNVFARVGQLPAMGFVLALVVLVGAVLLWRHHRREFRRHYGPTVGLVVGALAFAVIIGYGRGESTVVSPLAPRAGRYVHILAALLLPLIALAASSIADRWRAAYPVMVAMFLVAIPGNVAKLHATGSEVVTLGDPGVVLTMAHLPLARDVPRASRPFASPYADFSVGWLLDSTDDGKVPEAGATDVRTIPMAELLLSLNMAKNPQAGLCSVISPTRSVRVQRGDYLEINAPSVTIRRVLFGNWIQPTTYRLLPGRVLRAVAGPLDLIVEVDPVAPPPLHCR